MSAPTCQIKTSPNLVDVQVRHARYPDSFEIPTITEVLDIRVGDQVKIYVEDQVIKGGLSGERIWGKVLHVEVIEHEYELEPTHTFIVQLTNVPYSDGLSLGDVFFVTTRHILDTHRAGGVSRDKFVVEHPYE